MIALAHRVAGGAAWMVGFRMVQRGIGFVSTVILARLLVPEDFGIVAMAMTVYALVDMIGEFGFDLALIQNQNAERRHYDTAWTFNVVYRSLGAIALAFAAPAVAGAFEEPRLEAVVQVIAVVALVQGFENIGIVAFRKEIRFNLEFYFRLAKKLVAFVVTVTLAFLLQNYWALVFGILASHIASTALSYIMHPYRPRPSFSATKELFSFSGWVFANSMVRYGKMHGPDILLGKLVGSGGLGIYRIAREVATLPTTELYAPIMRVVFPGFSQISHNQSRLREAYLSMQGVVATVTLPAGVGIIVLADPLVRLLLGTQWLAAIPVIQIIGLHGLIQVLHGNRFSLFMALGQPYWVAFMNLLQIAIVLPLMAWWLAQGASVEFAVWSLVVASVTTLPVGLWLVTRAIDLSATRFLAVQCRPAVAAAGMAGAIWFVVDGLSSSDGALTAFRHLVIGTITGGLTYVVLLVALWYTGGRPAGAETRILELIDFDRRFGALLRKLRRYSAREG